MSRYRRLLLLVDSASMFLTEGNHDELKKILLTFACCDKGKERSQDTTGCTISFGDELFAGGTVRCHYTVI